MKSDGRRTVRTHMEAAADLLSIISFKPRTKAHHSLTGTGPRSTSLEGVDLVVQSEQNDQRCI